MDTEVNTMAETAQPASVDTEVDKEADNVETDASAPADVAGALEGLTANIQDKADLDRDTISRLQQKEVIHEDQQDQKRITVAEASILRLQNDERKAHQKKTTYRHNQLVQRRVTAEVESIHAQIATLECEIKESERRIEARHHPGEAEQEAADLGGANQRPNETRREFLIRTGKITPFAPIAPERDGGQGGLDEALAEAEEEAATAPQFQDTGPESHRNLTLPGFGAAYDNATTTAEEEFHLRSRKKRRIADGPPAGPSKSKSSTVGDDPNQDFTPASTDRESGDEDYGFVAAGGGIKKKGKKRARDEEDEETIDLSNLDDGNEHNYQRRLQDWVVRRSKARREYAAKAKGDDRQENSDSDAEDQADSEEEWFKPCPNPETPDHLYSEGLKVPGDIYHSLYEYQKVGVQWFAQLQASQVGGILADEMGLGKTVQVISFLAGLHFSKKLSGPVIIVTPATVLKQWVKEFHLWWPPLRVSILHSSGSGMLNVKSEDEIEDDDYPRRSKKSKAAKRNSVIDEDGWDSRYGRKPPKSSKAAKRIADTVVQKGHVLVTTYSGLETYKDILTKIDWAYAVLDEGHKIRNPESFVTYSCKSLRTPNRVILSGTPMQNHLIELWSLFDFVCPMRLGNLVNFRNQFDVPIKQGGYANASNLQVMAAEKCARSLKEVISPYFMQRVKNDVASDLPKKEEKVLLCKLTKPQREAYISALASPDIAAVIHGSRNALTGINLLTKICNHPDLADELLKHQPGYHWGSPSRSGKMQVVKNLLEHFTQRNEKHGEGHKVLLFSQGKLMLNLLEAMVKKANYRYLRMDGGTPVPLRSVSVDQFNNDPDVFVFLLTTKVGGLGINLISANQVIIFDPNWNPATDLQAQERAWRLGQKRDVRILRLMSAGTIEEKIYQRQIYKKYTTDKVLKDPSKRSTFQPKELRDLFTFTETSPKGETETGRMFQGTEMHFSALPDAASPEASTAQPVGSMQRTKEEEDISNLTGLNSIENYQNTSEDAPADMEDRLMNTIFARSGVFSAVSHDEIINGKPTADRRMLEREANRIAREAETELRKAGEEARHIPAGQVTWTGHQGSAGRPQSSRPAPRRAGPSSAGVLANLQDRQNSTSSTARRSTKDFATLVTRFIQVHNPNGSTGPGVPTQMIYQHFTSMCRTQRDAAEFKRVLERICFVKTKSTRSGMNRWALRESRDGGGGAAA